MTPHLNKVPIPIDKKKKLRLAFFKLASLNNSSDFVILTFLRHLKKVPILQAHSGKKRPKILAYQPFKDEFPILDLLQHISCEIFVPEVKGSCLRAISLKTKKYLSMHHIDMIICPGLFIQQNGYRLGRGGGFYDRTLCYFDINKTIFVGYSWQLKSSKNFPIDPHDKKIRFIVTEKNWYTTHEF